MSAVVLGVFFILGFLGMPLAFALGAAAVAGLAYGDQSLVQLAGKMVHSIDSFPLMAIPLFMLAGQLLIHGGIMDRLIDLANAVVGRVRGGLAHVTVVSAMGLSSVSGTAVADATALGGTLGPALTKAYGRGFGASVVATSSTMGPIIPPSAGMIVYAVMAENVSVGGLFIAGIVPGVLVGLTIMALCSIIASRRGYPLTGEPFSVKNVIFQLRRSIIIFLMPVLVVGGIVAGAFTATEGAAIAVLYALLLGFFVTRKLKLSHLPSALLNAGIITAVVGALIVFASTATYIFTIELLGVWLANFLQNVTTSEVVFIIWVVVVLVIAGMFIESNATYVMLVPLIAPIAVGYGIDPIYFGFMFVLANTSGSITPPVGILLFVVSGIWRLDMLTLVRHIWPFMLVPHVVIALCLLFPGIVLFLPRLAGY